MCEMTIRRLTGCDLAVDLPVSSHDWRGVVFANDS